MHVRFRMQAKVSYILYLLCLQLALEEEEIRETILNFDCFRLATLEWFLDTLGATVNWGSVINCLKCI